MIAPKGYMIYPAIDGEHNLPPEVRQALAGSPELQNSTSTIVVQLMGDESSQIRQELDLLYGGSSGTGGNIDGGTP